MTIALISIAMAASAPQVDLSRCASLRASAMAGSLSSSSFGGGVLAVGLASAATSIYAIASFSDAPDYVKKPLYVGAAIDAAAVIVGGIIMGTSSGGYQRAAVMDCTDIVAADDARIAERKRVAASSIQEESPPSGSTEPPQDPQPQ